MPLRLLLVVALACCTGEVVPGDPGDITVPGDPTAGDSAPGDPMPGDTMPGDPMAGDPAPGDPATGDPQSGDPTAGDPLPALGTTQLTFDFDLGTGSHSNTELQTGSLVRSGSGPGSWLSATLDTGHQYCLWEGITFTGTNLGEVDFETSTSPDGSIWSEWSEIDDLVAPKTVLAPQDRYLRARITFEGGSTGSVDGITVACTPAFPFEIDPFHDGASEWDTSAGTLHPVVIQNGDFFFDDGGTLTPARFYGIQMFSPSNFPTHAQADQVCVNLRKLGFNLIKTHIVASTSVPGPRSVVQLYQDGTIINSGSALNLDPAQLDRLDYFLARCMQEGIYVYFRLMAPRPHLGDTFADLADRPTVEFSEYFEPTHQQFHRAFYTLLLEHPNPYRSNTAYKDEVGIPFYELTNENTLFRAWHHTDQEPLIPTETVPLEYWRYSPQHPITLSQSHQLDALWNQWLVNRYTDGAGVTAVWGDETEGGLYPGEDPATGSVIRTDWRYPGHRQTHCGRDNTRIRDMALFYQELEIAFFSAELDYIRNTLSARGHLVGSNLYRGSYSLESQSVADFIDTHAYWGNMASSDYAPMLQSVNDLEPSIISRAVRSHVQGKPLTVSEYNGHGHSPFNSEILPVVASYGAFHSWDAIVLFDYMEYSFDETEMFKVFNHASMFDPVKVTQLPIVSRAYRDWIKEANVVIEMVFSDVDEASVMLNGQWGTLGLNEGGWNNTRYLRNNVLFEHGFQVASFDAASPPDFDDYATTYGVVAEPPAQTLSDTGELWVDGDTGVFYPLHSHFQGAVGMTGGASHTMPPDVDIEVANSAYGSTSILLGSLDGQRLRDSTRILLVAGARAENYELLWQHDRARVSLDDEVHYNLRQGVRPVLVTGTRADIALTTSRADLGVYPLDRRGVRTRAEVPSVRSGGVLRFRLQPEDETLWYVIRPP